MKVSEVYREHGIRAATFYKWRSRYGGLDASILKRVKEQEAENARLKKMDADVQLEASAMKAALRKK
ncbi:MAG: transposase [Planctomycetota bacterium]